MRKDITGLLEVKYKNNDGFEYEDDFDFYEGYSSDEEWKDAIKKKYIYKTNKNIKQEEIDTIFSMTKSIINGEDWYASDEYLNKVFETATNIESIEKEMTDDMFDENGKLLLDKLYPELKKDKSLNFQNNDENEEYFYTIALSVVADNESLENTLIYKKEEIKIPDYAFIENHYVPKYLLEKHNIFNDCKVNARVIYGEDKMNRPKWKVINIEKYNI